MSTPEFREWPKTSRYLRDVVVTEKIDGTNAAIIVQPGQPSDSQDGWCGIATDVLIPAVPPSKGVPGRAESREYCKVGAQSRSRIITPNNDNHGFARWVSANAEFLGGFLGPGYHFGEWWGLGIQRNYGQKLKWFSLFNAEKWASLAGHMAVSSEQGPIRVGPGDPALTANLGVVPVLYAGINDTLAVRNVLESLRTNGSVAAPGFANPEGICIFHTASRLVQKLTLDKEDRGKWEL